MTEEELSPEQRPGTVHRHKARRAHTCAECPVPIQPGETYMFLNTFDRGRWSRYVLCQKCERIRNCHKVAELALGQEFSCTAGKLRDEVKMFHRSIRNYGYEFRKAWEASEPIEEKRA